jgi:glutaredoxin
MSLITSFIKCVALLCLCALAVTAQAAKLYKWVDKDGNVSYQDRPPPSTAGRIEERDLRTGPTAGPDAAERLPVVLYSVPKCQGCDLARAYLQKRQIPFTEKNVQSDVALQTEMKQKTGGLSVPTITVGSKVMQGYMESLLEGELEQAGYAKPAAEEGAPPQQ